MILLTIRGSRPSAGSLPTFSVECSVLNVRDLGLVLSVKKFRLKVQSLGSKAFPSAQSQLSLPTLVLGCTYIHTHIKIYMYVQKLC